MERVATLEEENARLREKNRQLREKNEHLKQQWAAVGKDSSTSSKPPSSDIVQPKKPPAKGGKKRSKGGQPGHEQHLRTPFPSEAVNQLVPHTLVRCPDCGGTLVLSRRQPQVLQQVEIVQTSTMVTEHPGLTYWCPDCHKVYYAPMPVAVMKAELFSPRPTLRVGARSHWWPS